MLDLYLSPRICESCTENMLRTLTEEESFLEHKVHSICESRVPKDAFCVHRCGSVLLCCPWEQMPLF